MEEGKEKGHREKREKEEKEERSIREEARNYIISLEFHLIVQEGNN